VLLKSLEDSVLKKIIALLTAAIMTFALFPGCNNSRGAESDPYFDVSFFDSSGDLAPTPKPPPTDDSWAQIEAKGTLVVGFDTKFPPMSFTNEENEFVGFDLDLAAAVCEELGLKLELMPIMNWNKAMDDLEDGKVDCIWSGFSVTPKRKEKLNMSVTYMQNCQVAVVSNASAYGSITDLEYKKVGVQRNSAAEDGLNSKPDITKLFQEVLTFPDYVTCMDALKEKKVAAVIMDETVARYFLMDGFRIIQDAGDEEGAPYSFSDELYAVGFRKGEDTLAAKILNTLSEMEFKGALLDISDKWFGTYVIHLPEKDN